MKKVFSWPCSARWSHAGHVPGRQECNTLAHSAHARAWLAHSACKFYRCERFHNISLKQLPPCLVQELLVSYNPFTLAHPSRYMKESRTHFKPTLPSPLTATESLSFPGCTGSGQGDRRSFLAPCHHSQSTRPTQGCQPQRKEPQSHSFLEP